MAEFKIIVNGYAKRTKRGIKASSSTVFIKEKKIKVIVDPGIDRKSLLRGLRKNGIRPEDINFVILTHYHLDHSLLAAIFKNAKILDDGEIYDWNGKIREHHGKVAGTNIEITKTPGHSIFHCSVVFKNKKFGKVCVAGDLFWWYDHEDQKRDIKSLKSLINKEDPYVKDWEKLKKSRKKILEVSDWVIPGHGKMFRVPSQ